MSAAAESQGKAMYVASGDDPSLAPEQATQAARATRVRSLRVNIDGEPGA